MEIKIETHISAVIFDFGGVLIEWEPRNYFRRYFPGQPQALEDFLKEIHFMEWNAQQDKGRSFSEGVALLSDQFPQYAEIIHDFHKHWADTIGHQIEENVETLRRLKEKGYSIYGLSNWSAETLPIARQRYNFFKLLDGMVISGEVKVIKPDPAIFRLLLQRIHKTAQECLFIDDAEANIVTAQQLGFDTIHFKSPDQLKAEVTKRNLL